MRIRWFAALAAVLLLGSAVGAQPDKAKPTVEVRLRSVNDLLTKGEYVGDLIGKGGVVKQVAGMVKEWSAGGKGLKGIDTKRPFGAQATLTADVINSSFTIMVPVADQNQFLAVLKDELQLNPEKADDGSYKVAVPLINDVHLRFANDYVYVGRTAADVDPKTIPTPKAFFGNDDGAVGSIVVHIDQIPAELKTFVLGQLELAVNEQKRAKADNASPAEKAGIEWGAENAASAIKTFLEDAKTLEARAFIDEKTDTLSGELTLTAKSGTTLAKNIASLAGKTSVPAAIVGGKDAAFRITAKAGLPDAVKKDLEKVVDAAIDDILKQVGEQEKPIAEKVLKSVAPTLKAGEIDAAASLTPNEKGHYTLIVAMGVKKGKDIEGLAKDLVKEFGGALGGAVDFDLDVEKVGDFTLHKVTVNAMPANAEKVFGTNKVWVAVSDDCVAMSVEPEGAALRAGLKAKAAPVPVLSVEVAAGKLVPLLSHALAPDEVKAIVKDAFGDGSPAGKDTLSITLTGGEKLTLKGSLKGKAVRFVAGFVLLGKR